MQPVRLEFRPSLRLISAISRLERLAGEWSRVSSIEACTQAEEEIDKLLLSATSLDASLQESSYDLEIQKWLKEASIDHYSFSADTLSLIFNKLFPEHPSPAFRKTAVNFLAPGIRSFDQGIVFPTVPAFLVEKRLDELMLWAGQELKRGELPQLLIIAVFHLLFLQIHPYKSGNHCISLLLLHKLLKEHGYPFVAYQPLAPEFEKAAIAYFQSLRQAEKTALDSWQSLNVWLEFFTLSLANCAQKLLNSTDNKIRYFRLTSSQKRILELVRGGGALSREQVSSQTGININTVKYNLKVLTESGHLNRVGAGRTTAYQSSCGASVR